MAYSKHLCLRVPELDNSTKWSHTVYSIDFCLKESEFGHTTNWPHTAAYIKMTTYNTEKAFLHWYPCP